MKKVIVSIVVIILLIGVGAFCYINFWDNKTKNEIVKEEKLKVDDGRFYDLYLAIKDYTFLNDKKSSNDFTVNELSEISIKNSDLKNSDFKENNGLYNISLKKIDKTLSDIFGKDVKYDKASSVNTNVSYTYDEMVDLGFKNYCSITVKNYDVDTDSYNVSVNKNCNKTIFPGPSIEYRKIVSADRNENIITVVEKLFYYSISENKLVYTLYSDPKFTSVIDTKTYQNIDETNGTSIKIDDYLDKCATITYKFKLDESSNKYYFLSSEIK